MHLVQIRHSYPGMFNCFYYDWPLAEAAKTAAQLHCWWVPKMKVLQPLQNSHKKTFPDRWINEFGSNEAYLSMFKSFYYDWTLAEAAKKAAQPHYGWVLKNEGAPPQDPAKKLSLTVVGMSLVQVKHIYPCLTAFIMTEHWLTQPKMLPSHTVVEHHKIEHAPNTTKSCK